MGSRKYKQLNDREWLEEQYVNQGKSTLTIAKEIGAPTGNSVRQALTRFGFPIRNRSVAQTNRRDDGFIFNEDVIYGSLLGDAGLKKFDKESRLSRPHFYKKNKHYSHVALVARSLFANDWRDRITTETKLMEDERELVYYRVSSFANDVLVPVYDAWYPGGGKKVIPEIEPSPLMLLHWFMDDGSSYHRRPESKTRQIIVTLSSQCFSFENQQSFCDRINQKFQLGLRPQTTNSGTGWRIHVPQSKATEFFNIIGPCPVKDMEYKWKAEVKYKRDG